MCKQDSRGTFSAQPVCAPLKRAHVALIVTGCHMRSMRQHHFEHWSTAKLELISLKDTTQIVIIITVFST